jgi:hypothetical protein
VDLSQNVILEIIKTALSGVTMIFGWIAGQRIVAYWDMKKKRQDVDLALAAQFQRLYGDFKQISRLWRSVTYEGKRNREVAFPEHFAADLLMKATAAEGSVESIIIKLATERTLTAEDIETLGLFRQAYQRLREAVRDGKDLNWTHGKPEYHLYDDLAAQVCGLISQGNRSSDTLEKITAVRPERWDRKVDEFRSRAKIAAAQGN